jgi:quercetin dioxygenase-like cupin family protein
MTDYFPALEQCPSREIFPGVRARTCWLDKMMLALVDLDPHSVVFEHQHPHEQVGMWLKGKAVFTIGGVAKTVQAGDWYRIPGNVRHKVDVLDQPSQALDIFSPPREEYK